MKLVLLPGMDGTGELFSDFVSNFDGETVVISLPQSGPQEHEFLAKAIERKLPNEDYILLAESFSGGIVPELLKRNLIHLKGVIFVASFLSCPNRLFLPIAKLLPLQALASAPLSKVAVKYLLLGQDASNTLLSKFVGITKSIPKQVLKNRLKVMSKQRLPLATFDIPSVYVQACSDKLITAQKSRELGKTFKNIRFIEVDGPHFILQAKPKESAHLVAEAIASILNYKEGS